MIDYKVDVVIVGGGIAGLFTLAKVINAGYSAVLIEKDAIGAGQTIKSQGIIHGGTKYALLGKLSSVQKTLSDMPKYWLNCISQQEDVDLSGTKLLSDHQYMWAMSSLSSTVTGFFASNLMVSQVKKIDFSTRPDVLQNERCKGNFYQLNEPVLDIKTLMASFVNHYQEYMITDAKILNLAEQSIDIRAEGKDYSFSATKIIFTAGESNEALSGVKQQVRPLHMVYVKVPKEYESLYVHILMMSDKPRMTVSSYALDAEKSIWYLGGTLAENSVNETPDILIEKARKELKEIFSWLSFDDLEFGSFMINRAEGEKKGLRPDIPIVVEKGDYLVAWPTKLAMAPVLADDLLKRLPPPKHPKVFKNNSSVRIASYPWEAN